jgi:type II secretory pathway pseudopilin PulG
MKCRAAETGFALAETLVAAAIIAAMLGVTFQSVTQSVSQNRMIEARRAAVLIAQSQMAAVGAAVNTGFGETRGITGGIPWRVILSPYQGGGSGSVRLDLVTVMAGSGPSGVPLATLRTLRLSR